MGSLKGSLGGKDAAGKNDWNIDENGDLIPGTTDLRNIGSATYKVKDIFLDGVVNLGGVELVVSGGALFFGGKAVTVAS